AFSRQKNTESMSGRSPMPRRAGSPPGGSILMTSAPSHARVSVQLGPASYWVRSRTRIPSSAFAIDSLLASVVWCWRPNGNTASHHSAAPSLQSVRRRRAFPLRAPCDTFESMRIATWNVNSLKARLEKVVWWLERAKPDVLLMQETKLSDADAPRETFQQAGYELAHHGEGRWNGVAIASRVGIGDLVSNFGQPLGTARTPDIPDDEPLAEARMISAVCGGVRIVSLYAPNGRTLDSPFYQAKLQWYERLARWLTEARNPGEAVALGGDFNIAPSDADVWDPVACHGGTHVSEPERRAFAKLCAWGLIDVFRTQHPESPQYTSSDYRA